MKVTAGWTFESFVASPASEAALRACQAVVANPGAAHNPLFLHGRTGAGKTHLLHAIEAAMRGNTMRMAAESLIGSLYAAARDKALQDFSLRFAGVDAILLDDLPPPDPRPLTIDDIARVLRELTLRGTQIVATSLLPPPMASQFERALVVEVGMPDEAARLELARRCAARERLEMAEDALRFVAARATGGVREVQSILARVAAEASISPRALEPSRIREVVERMT